nr:PEP-CTERM sorting domain-containing protein [uncultured Massilia sp.]
MHARLLAPLFLAAGLALAQGAQAVVLQGTSGSNAATDYSTAGTVAFDLDLASFAPTTFRFTLEEADLAGPLAFNALVRNVSGAALDRFSFSLEGIAFAASGSVTPAFGTIGAVSFGPQAANIAFATPEWAEFQFGNPFGDAAGSDWLLATTGLHAGDTFTITAANTVAAEVPEPATATLMMPALCMLGLMAARKRRRG